MFLIFMKLAIIILMLLLIVSFASAANIGVIVEFPD